MKPKTNKPKLLVDIYTARKMEAKLLHVIADEQDEVRKMMLITRLQRLQREIAAHDREVAGNYATQSRADYVPPTKLSDR